MDIVRPCMKIMAVMSKSVQYLMTFAPGPSLILVTRPSYALASPDLAELANFFLETVCPAMQDVMRSPRMLRVHLEVLLSRDQTPAASETQSQKLQEGVLAEDDETTVPDQTLKQSLLRSHLEALLSRHQPQQPTRNNLKRCKRASWLKMMKPQNPIQPSVQSVAPRANSVHTRIASSWSVENAATTPS